MEGILVSGPTALNSPSQVNRVDVVSAQQMFEAMDKHFQESDIVVMSAAVADYTPVEVADQKIKKKAEDFSIDLKKTTDILASLGKQKRDNQTLVGFALETNNELAHAKDKLERKNLDFIVLNSMQDKGAGFAHNTNKITVINRSGEVTSYELKSKDEVAKDICNLIIQEQSKS